MAIGTSGSESTPEMLAEVRGRERHAEGADSSLAQEFPSDMESEASVGKSRWSARPSFSRKYAHVLLRPTVESMDSSPENSVVLLDPRYWGEHAWQLASILRTGIRGPIGDVRGSLPDRVATIVAPQYWSRHASELSDALLDGDRRASPCHTEVVGAFSSGSSERLTMTVEEVAKALGISRAFAYEAVHRGDIPHIRIGKRMLVPRAALARVLAAVEPPDES